jgi:hypothetical protein
MARTYSYLDLVRLPRLDGMAAQALGAEVLAAAKDRRLPEAIADARAGLESACTVLKAAAVSRLPTTVTGDPSRSKTADVIVDACWGALFDVLSGWSKLPDDECAEIATDLLAQIYPEGLKFVLFSYKLEWAESNTRIAIIKERKLDKSIEKLGAGPILKRLREAHKEYGEALGVTAASAAPAATAGIRDALDGFSDALRRYVVCVSASIRSKDPKSSELAQHLLDPIQRWESSAGSKQTVEPEPEPSQGSAPEPPASSAS